MRLLSITVGKIGRSNLAIHYFDWNLFEIGVQYIPVHHRSFSLVINSIQMCGFNMCEKYM